MIDTGPVVAFFDRNAPYHDACSRCAKELTGRVFTCWPVIAEACYLLRHRSDLVDALLEACHDGIYEILPLTSVETFLKLVARYPNTATNRSILRTHASSISQTEKKSMS